MGTIKSGAKKLVGATKKLIGKSSTKKSRRKSPTYWANKVLTEKLKKKYQKLKYGGMR